MRTRTDNSFMPRIGIAQIAIESKTCPNDSGPNNQIYIGRTSGFGNPKQLVEKRLSRHHMKAKGFGNPRIDKAIQGASGKPAIRGREQQLIDYYGGIGGKRGRIRVANSIRGVSKANPLGRFYHYQSNKAFGNIAPYTGY